MDLTKIDLMGVYGVRSLTGTNDHGLNLLASGECFPLGCNSPPDGCGTLWHPPSMQGHGLTLGATRNGKGVCAIIPALLSYAGSMVVIDPKGENAWLTAQRRREMGQRVVILDPWGEVNRRYGSKLGQLEQTTKFNPLSSLNPKSRDFADDLAAIGEALIIPGLGEPHWTDSAREFVSGITGALAEMAPGVASMRQLRHAATQEDADLLKLIADLREAIPNSLGARKLRRFAKEKVTNEISSVRSVAETQTAFLDSETLLNGMETDANPFNLAELATGRVTLYLVLPVDRLQSHGRWLRLILTLAIRAIARQDEAPALPVVFMLDEMGTIGKLAMIEQAFGLMAGLGIRIWGFLQDLSQLQRDYKDSWQTFLSNSSFIQVLNATDPVTSEYVSKYIGTETVTYYDDIEKKEPKSGASRLSKVILLPQQIREMDKDQQIILQPGYYSVIQHRMRYYEVPDWHDLYRALPKFPKGERPVPPAAPEPERKGWFR